MKTGIELIAVERENQKRNYSSMNDDNYTDGQLQMAAEALIDGEDGDFPAGWDLVKVQKMCDKPKLDRLIISGAFYLAERDRIERRVIEIAAEIDRLQSINQ